MEDNEFEFLTNDADVGETIDEENTEVSVKDQATTKSFIFDWLEVLIHAVIMVVICFSFIFRIATIDGESMMNTLNHGERVIISKMFYEPKAGDVVVISRNNENSIHTMTSENTPIIKRIIATEGQMVEIDFEKGEVYVDKVLESYVESPRNLRKYDIDFPVIVPEGHVFVLGDNRNNSLDSRSSQIGNYGMIDTRYILGRVIVRVSPFDRFGRIDG